MPLIIISGLPSSGKTTILKIIEGYIKEKISKSDEKSEIGVKFVHDGLRTTFSRAVFRDSAQEREQRAFLRSEVQKHLNNKTTVICDSLNYIKGFRYELFCLAKLAKTSCCVVFCDVGPADAEELNTRKVEEERWVPTRVGESALIRDGS